MNPPPESPEPHPDANRPPADAELVPAYLSTGGSPSHDIPPLATSPSAYAPPGFVAPQTGQSSPSKWLVAFLVGLSSPIAALIVSLTVMVGVLLLTADASDLRDVSRLQQWMIDFTTTIPGLMVMVVPAQLTFLVIAYGCAKFAKEGWAKRLALVKSRVPVLTWPIFALATPVIGLVSSIVVSWFLQLMQWNASEHLEALESVLTSFTGPNFVLLVVMVSIIPGVCEELLFRGFVQSRLVKTWSPVLAIGFSSVCFAFAHMDPMHMVIVFPIGVWLGVVSWKAGTIWPAILGHVINNLVSVVGSQAGVFGLSESAFFSGVMLISGLALIVSVGLVVALPTSGKDAQ